MKASRQKTKADPACFRLKAGSHLLISGPCSAESEAQLMAVSRAFRQGGRVDIFRAGLWKPRTRPASFTGVGERGLPWLQQVQQEGGIPVCTEVALPEHVEHCLKFGIRILWVGARTVSNPFSVQEIADAVRGTDCCIMVKNPLHPDPELWAGALDRFLKAGIEDLAAIHRGFYPFEKSRMRNIPKWEMAIGLKLRYPGIPVICDPSHMSGDRIHLQRLAQKALDLNMDGLMIECHPRPASALSDARQQITPRQFYALLDKLDFRCAMPDAAEYAGMLEPLRDQVDSIDAQVVELLAARMKIAEQIGAYKRDHDLAILQVRRWQEIVDVSMRLGRKGGLSMAFIEKLLNAIHEESNRKHTLIYRKGKK